MSSRYANTNASSTGDARMGLCLLRRILTLSEPTVRTWGLCGIGSSKPEVAEPHLQSQKHGNRTAMQVDSADRQSLSMFVHPRAGGYVFIAPHTMTTRTVRDPVHEHVEIVITTRSKHIHVSCWSKLKDSQDSFGPMRNGRPVWSRSRSATQCGHAHYESDVERLK